MLAKRVFLLLLIFLIGSASLFAEASTVASGQFLLFHNINVSKKFYFQFVNPSTGTEIPEETTVELGGFGEYVRFTRLILNYINV